MTIAALLLLALDAQPILWRDPGRVEAIDFTLGAGGPGKAPKQPFTFVRENDEGTSPKVTVKDANGIEWRVKGGLEVRAEAFVTRFVNALGYYAESTYFIANGRIEGVKPLKRASGFVKSDGSFTYAAFERREPNMKFVKGPGWSWNKSPFEGTRELNGLRILVMLCSNWDNKDSRDVKKGSNTGVLELNEGSQAQHLYFVNDWGQTMGKWGRLYGRVMWDCQGYTGQTANFVKAVNGKRVLFGYAGQHTDDFKAPVTVDDVRWLMQYLGRITDAQIETGLLASGATKDEQECFTRALRDRIGQLRKVAGAIQ